MDTNLKVWDIRHKSCIQTYKGHSKQINDVRFSPDGRWVISGSLDGAVKLWDLTAGKLLHDFPGHSKSVSALRFNQNEFLMASASADRTVKFWDLETFELIGCTDKDVSPVKSIAFAEDGQTVLAAGQANMKVRACQNHLCVDLLLLLQFSDEGRGVIHFGSCNELI
jgi:katanin p80 WD40 repeat-containing subunit B1